MRNLKLIWKILVNMVKAFIEDKCLKLAAALAYYTVFSLPPMLMIVIAIGSFFYGEEAVQGELFGIMSGYIGAEQASRIEDVLSNISFQRNSRIATIIGVTLLVFGATRIFGEIQDSINLIWGLKTKPKKNWIFLIVSRLISFSMVVVLGFLLLVSLTINTLLEIFFERLETRYPDSIVNLVYFLDYVVIFLVVVALFALIFKVLPDAIIKWKHVALGAFVTGALFMAGKFLISLYLTDTYLVLAYGGAGSLVVLLIWVYYSAIILYLGAEFTQTYIRHRGLRIMPSRFAVFIDEIEVERADNQPEQRV